MPPRLLVDHTHLGRTVTGLERITLELFSRDSLAPLQLEPIGGGRGTARMMLDQQLALPARLAADRSAVLLCPGFPPSVPVSLFGRRVVPYIHDCFLLTRPQDLNWRARAYMAPAFRFAVRHLPWFLVNSETTAAELGRFTRPGAGISLYRPVVRDVFGLAAHAATAPRRVRDAGRLDLLALGTIEPRKNLAAAAAITAALRDRHGLDARLHLVGRPGWGGEAERLAALPGVVVHGYQPAETVRALVADADLLLSTSHDEGLGLPLIEAQYAGLPVAAPDRPVFREVLGSSGLFIEPADPADAADRIVASLAADGAAKRARASAAANIARWNGGAAADRDQLIERLSALPA